MNFKLILASKSPRRKELMESLGIPFTIKTMEVDESYPQHLPAHEVASYLATKKGEAYKKIISADEVAITADTTVIHQYKVLNKPLDVEDASKMLNNLSGSRHEVITSACIITHQDITEICEKTTVYFHHLTKEEINHYINKYKPFDKAGAYAIQEWLGMIGIQKIEGSYYNVVGLPIDKIYHELRKIDGLGNLIN